MFGRMGSLGPGHHSATLAEHFLSRATACHVRSSSVVTIECPALFVYDIRFSLSGRIRSHSP